MKKIMMLVCVFCLICSAAMADEAALQETLTAATEAAQAAFFCDDFDNDGVEEAFAVTETDQEGMTDLWFVTEAEAVCMLNGVEFAGAAVNGAEIPCTFTLNGEQSWYVTNGQAFAYEAMQLEVVGGDVKMRTEPNLNAEILNYLKEGQTAEYLYAISTDERGVDWYKANFDGQEGWISSKYSELKAAE